MNKEEEVEEEEVLKEISQEEVEELGYIIIDGLVYDFKEFEKKHPGGEKVLVYYRGKDGSNTFHKIPQHKQALGYAKQFLVGALKKEEKVGGQPII